MSGTPIKRRTATAFDGLRTRSVSMPNPNEIAVPGTSGTLLSHRRRHERSTHHIQIGQKQNSSRISITAYIPLATSESPRSMLQDDRGPAQGRSSNNWPSTESRSVSKPLDPTPDHVQSPLESTWSTARAHPTVETGTTRSLGAKILKLQISRSEQSCDRYLWIGIGDQYAGINPILLHEFVSPARKGSARSNHECPNPPVLAATGPRYPR